MSGTLGELRDDLDVEPHPPEPQAAPQADDADLVHLSLRTVGRHRLLTKAQEVVLAERIERAQAELLKALAALPAAVRSLTDRGA